MRVPDNEAGSRMKEFQAGPGAAGSRLDQWLSAALGDDFSRNRIQALIRHGLVAVAGATVKEPGRRLAGGETIEVALPEPEMPEPQGEDIALDILYEDASIIVVNKPAGLVVHPGAGNWTGTLVNALIHHCGKSLSGIGGVRRPGIVHRLDKDTSGVMVAAKTDKAHRILSEAFADHGVTGAMRRVYAALVWGVPSRMSGVIDAPLGRASDRVRRAVVPAGRGDARHAVTHFEVRQSFAEMASLVECRLETGRTHQIRVHMAHIGHPVIGDRDYGQAFRTKANRLPQPLRGLVEAFPRQALHARLLEFMHPETGIAMRFEAPPPDDMRDLLAAFELLKPTGASG